MISCIQILSSAIYESYWIQETDISTIYTSDTYYNHFRHCCLDTVPLRHTSGKI